MQSFLECGATLVFASEYPVTTVPNPFVAIQTGVIRNLVEDPDFGLKITDMDAPAYLLWPEERLSVVQMLQGYTIDAAYATFDETLTGSLEVGKAADMIVIDQNLFAVDPLAIKNTKVLRTYLDGQLVYCAEE